MSTCVGRGRGLTGLVAAVALLGATAAPASAADYKVLVVRSTDDALSRAGTAAIRDAARPGKFTVVAPSPGDVGDHFTSAKLQQYRAVVFLNTGLASPLNDAQREQFEAYFRACGEPVPDHVGQAAIATAWWASRIAGALHRAMRFIDDPAWVRRNVDEALPRFERLEPQSPRTVPRRRAAATLEENKLTGQSHRVSTIVSPRWIHLRRTPPA